MHSAAGQRSERVGVWIGLAVLAVVAVWAYLPTGRALIRVWDTDPNYSQGFLVPVLAAGLFWYRVRGEWPSAVPAPAWGLCLIALAVAARSAGAYYFVTPLDCLSLLMTLFGVCLLFGGRPWLTRVWPALALLVFMFPLPDSLGRETISGALQGFATRSSTFALQTFGLVAVRDGNVILLRNAELGVVEACSGLKMLMVFCSLAAVTAAILPVGHVRKVLILLSAVPLAIACNTIRITTAGLASTALSTEAGHFVFHDLAGWLMVPLAFVLLGVEVYLLGKLFRSTEGAPVGAAELVSA